MRTLEECEYIYNELSGGVLLRYQSEANARYILYGVKETNMPRFASNLDDSLNNQAYLYISIGLDYYELGANEKSEDCFERAGIILEYINRNRAHQDNYSQYGMLISALSYYCAGQISKSFVVANEIDNDMPIGLMVKLWLHKELENLQSNIDKILIFNNFRAQEEFIFAQSLCEVISYIQMGDIQFLKSSIGQMRRLRDYSLQKGEPDIWVVSALMAHIYERLEATSLWTHIPRLGKNQEIVTSYIHNLYYSNHIFELFKTQIEALDVILKDEGAVISLPTSSGKTRIAELAILKALMADPESAVLYLAPFRSLAYEVETNFEAVFAPLKIHVSHLYGDNDFTAADQTMMEESSVWIATPEKAKVIFRYGGFKKRISLVVMDEGHLIDQSPRYVANEMFVEELRSKIESYHGQFLMLSAVLPNAQEMAQWLTKDEENRLVSQWQLSSQRTGIIVNYPAKVELEWSQDRSCFNPNFIVDSMDDATACAAIAKRFQEFGSVLVFVGQAQDVMRQAESIYRIVADERDVDWIDDSCDWEKFKLLCEEEDATGEILKYAKKGIICHSGMLPDNLRFSMERLLRKGKNRAKYIVATSTLAQGVNIGVTSVIFASVDYSYHRPINKRDFWNVAGRAGRAFCDTEGRILYYVKAKEQWQYDWYKKQAWFYMADKSLDDVKSGVLSILQDILSIGKEFKLSIEQIEEIVEHDLYVAIPDKAQEIQEKLDLLDDSIMSILLEKESSSDSVDQYLDTTLAFQQAESDDKVHIKRLMAARYRRDMKYAENDKNYFTCTGLSLAASTYLLENIHYIQSILHAYQESLQTLEDLLSFVDQFENIVLGIPSRMFKKVKKEHLDRYRVYWFEGKEIEKPKIRKAIREFYKNSVPWALNALSSYFKRVDTNDIISDVIVRLSTCIGLGMPSYWACRIYMCGVESRHAAMELSLRLHDYSNEPKDRIRSVLMHAAEKLKDISLVAIAWLKTLQKEKMYNEQKEVKVKAFTCELQNADNPKLYICKYARKFYLRNADYSYVIKWHRDDYDLNAVANIPGLYLARTFGNSYSLMSDNFKYRIVNR